MAMLDKQFRRQCQPAILTLERSGGEGEQGGEETEITVRFSESSLARNILGNMDELSCIYTAQILPRTDRDSMEVFVFDKQPDRMFSGISKISLFKKISRR